MIVIIHDACMIVEQNSKIGEGMMIFLLQRIIFQQEWSLNADVRKTSCLSGGMMLADDFRNSHNTCRNCITHVFPCTFLSVTERVADWASPLFTFPLGILSGLPDWVPVQHLTPWPLISGCDSLIVRGCLGWSAFPPKGGLHMVSFHKATSFCLQFPRLPCAAASLRNW